MELKYSILLIIVLLISSCDDEGINPVYGCMNPNYEEYDPSANIDDGSCSDTNLDLTYYDSDIYPLFLINGCLGCHTGFDNGGLDLSTYNGTINGSNNGSIIDLDNPSESLLFTTFYENGLMCDNIGICYSWDQLDINTIIAWINLGALEN